MASVYRKTVTKPLPNDAEIFTRKGERFARWKDAKNKTRTAPLTGGRDGSDRIAIKAGTYTAKYRDGEGIVREVATGCRSKDGAMSVLKDLTDRAEKVKSKILTPAEDRISDHQDILFADHVAAYIDHQTAKGVTPARISFTKARLERIAAERGIRRIGEFDASAVERWLLDRQAEGMSAGTRNGYRESCIGFANWCVRTGRLLSNPLATVPKADAKADCRRKRRALTEDELTQLLETTRRRPLVDAMTVRRGKRRGQAVANLRDETRSRLQLLGRERALIYKVYLLTGLRKSELGSLTVGQLAFDGPVAFATLDAADEKNRQGSDIPLRADLAAELQGWLVDKLATLRAEARRRGEPIPENLPAATPVFNVPSGLLRILDRDLKAAGIPKKDDRGRTIDVHALRHTFGTHLSKAGVAPRTAQAAMRHSSIDLTMNVYTDPRLLDVHGALDALPAMPLDTEPDQDQVVVKATGTNDKTAFPFAPGFAPTADKRSEFLSIVDRATSSRNMSKDDSDIAVSLEIVKQKQPSSTADNGCPKVGVTGFEPATSTSRT